MSNTESATDNHVNDYVIDQPRAVESLLVCSQFQLRRQALLFNHTMLTGKNACQIISLLHRRYWYDVACGQKSSLIWVLIYTFLAKLTESERKFASW